MSNRFERNVTIRGEDGTQGKLGSISVEKKGILSSGLTKSITIPQVFILVDGLPPIEFGPYVGWAYAEAKDGQVSEFIAEQRNIRYIQENSMNMRTGKRGLPTSVPETEVSPGVIRQRVVPGALQLHQLLSVVGAASESTLDPRLVDVHPLRRVDKRIDNIELFKRAVVAKMIATSMKALEELHTTSIQDESLPADKIAVLQHGDIEEHLGNILLVPLPGLNWLEAFVIDLARVQKVAARNMPFTTMEEWYRENPMLSQENLVLGETIARLATKVGLALPPSLGQDPYTSEEAKQAYALTVRELGSNLQIGEGAVERMIQDNLLRLFVHTLITSQQRQFNQRQFTIEDSGAFAQTIEELFMSEDTPTQEMPGIVKP